MTVPFIAASDFTQLFSKLEALTVGYGPVFKNLQSTPQFPPHNIVRISDNAFYIELALAGFKKTEIEVKEFQGLLTVTGDKKLSPVTQGSYQFNGIANRSFTKRFQVAEYFDVVDAVMEDGILTINFVKNTPEVLPKSINIK